LKCDTFKKEPLQAYTADFELAARYYFLLYQLQKCSWKRAIQLLMASLEYAEMPAIQNREWGFWKKSFFRGAEVSSS
jgi:hypothetical protein